MSEQNRDTLPAQRSAGVCLHLTSLPGSYGIGEIGQSALAFVDRMRQMNLRVWQFLPTGPTAFGDSPYQPLSSFAGNELLIDVQELIELGLLKNREAGILRSLPRDRVDYSALIPAKNQLLRRAAERFSTVASSDLKSERDDFVASCDGLWLHDYALFRILKTRHQERPWPEWHPEYVHRDPAAMRAIEKSAAAEIEATKLIQFLFHKQWQRLRKYANARGVQLFGDMPICIALDSADAWAHPEMLQIDENGRPQQVAGVPPDYFSEDGQLWGNPLYAWDAHAETGYSWWIARLNAATDLADLVRIDHFRGFEAYWSIPAEATNARTGEWLTGPGDAIFDAMRNALGKLPIVAEDLGVITPAVESLRDRHSIPGMVVLQFETADADFNPKTVPEYSVCYTGTHDNDTTVGWFRGSPGELRSRDEVLRTQRAVLKLTAGSPETIHMDLVRLAFATDARLSIAPLQDFLGLGSEARINTPGTASGNWAWRVQPEQVSDRMCAEVAATVSEFGRAAH